MRLAPFIRGNTKKIIVEWEAFAATLVPAADDMNSRALRNHISEMLAFVTDDIEAPQTSTEQISKSRGEKAKAAGYSAAETHSALRLAGGFSLDQMVSEFRALRASVTKLWEKQLTEPGAADIADLIRFNESLDQILTETVQHYSTKLNESKNLFLGILKEDLSESLGSLATAAGLTLRLGRLHERQAMLVSEMGERAIRATQTVALLLDLTRARLGSGLPVVRQSMDIGFVTKKLTDEMRTAHPRREFDVAVFGNLEGNWDKARVGQLLSNLLGNSVRYGFSDSIIGVKIEGLEKEVVLSVHNEGVPIPAAAIPKIFYSLNRASALDGELHPEAVNLGLGLYISEEIVTAHGGKIAVTSSEKDGTTFTVRLPRTMTTSSI